MNLNSITTKISLIFFIAVCILIALFFFSIDYENKQKHSGVISYHQNISNFLKQERMPKHEVVKYLKTLSFEDSRNPFEVIPNGKVIYMERGFETIEYKNQYYFHVITPFFRVLFKDLTVYKNTTYSYILFPILLLLLISIYIWLIKSLQPLKDLKENISSFSKGDLSISCKSDKKDEIADVSNEFDSAVRKIELLLNSRQLFLRTVMHELKTPIAKGRIVSELIDNNKQKDRMITIFERLDYLINDFSRIEQIVSENYNMIKQRHNINEVVQDALNVLMIENSSEKVKIELLYDNKINIDLPLMSMVFKNLIDNALRYSSDSKVIIQEGYNEILFISLGQKLPKEIEEYYKPFHNDTQSKNHGMGLGLYIVKSILDIHNFSFDYLHENDKNIFRIKY